ncbi:DUF914-domain-containing protein, partial [Rozella allomycis CSF55]
MNTLMQDSNIKKVVTGKILALIILNAIIDLEANFLIVTSFEYASVTSIVLANSMTVPFAMIMSTKYRKQHFIGVIFCLLGLIFLIVQTNQPANDLQSSSYMKGMLLAVGGAFLYALANTVQEYLLNYVGSYEYLGLLSAFGLIFGISQSFALEYHKITQMDSSNATFLAFYALAIFVFYSLVPFVILHTSATALNLSLLTTYIYTLIGYMILFNQKLEYWYFGSFSLVLAGLALFYLTPEQTFDIKGESKNYAINIQSE